MTLVVAFRATDGVALMSDTRKWLRSGSYVDGHQKLVRSLDGLITGAGSGQLLDHVSAHVGRRLRAEVVLLIAQTAAHGAMQGESAEWTMTFEPSRGASPDMPPEVDLDVFDGFHFRPKWWSPGSLPSGLPSHFAEQAASCVKSVLDEKRPLEEIRGVALRLYSDLYPSELVSPAFDFGTHRPGGEIVIERLQVRRYSTIRQSRPTAHAPSHARSVEW
jgi:hypothetical protein